MELDREEWLTSMKFFSPDSNDEIDLDEFEPGPIIRQLISDKIGPQVEKTIDDMFYIKLREKVLKIMPRHWVKRIVDIVTFQVGIFLVMYNEKKILQSIQFLVFAGVKARFIFRP